MLSLERYFTFFPLLGTEPWSGEYSVVSRKICLVMSQEQFFDSGRLLEKRERDRGRRRKIQFAYNDIQNMNIELTMN